MPNRLRIKIFLYYSFFRLQESNAWISVIETKLLTFRCSGVFIQRPGRDEKAEGRMSETVSPPALPVGSKAKDPAASAPCPVNSSRQGFLFPSHLLKNQRSSEMTPSCLGMNHRVRPPAGISTQPQARPKTEENQVLRIGSPVAEVDRISPQVSDLAGP